MLSYLTMTPNQEFENNPLHSKEKIFLSTYPLDKYYILMYIIKKFGCPKSKSSCPKSFIRFLSQIELPKTNEMAPVWQS